jgi:formylglycine-generating enzyme required for sulfatase activity
MTYYSLCGGSWFRYAWSCCVSYRNGFEPGYRYVNIGFRLIKTIKS